MEERRIVEVGYRNTNRQWCDMHPDPVECQVEGCARDWCSPKLRCFDCKRSLEALDG